MHICAQEIYLALSLVEFFRPMVIYTFANITYFGDMILKVIKI